MQEKNVVVIGAGPGTDIALMGLKRHTSGLTALVSTFDASSRRHHFTDREVGAYDNNPSDEVRSSLLALGTDPATTVLMERLFSYRFAGPSDMGHYTFGNLFLSALKDITGATDLALQAAAQVLNVQGQVLPLTLHESPLVVELTDGSEEEVSTPAELVQAASQVGLLRVRPARPVPALQASLQAIADADIVVLGPADLYFGLIAPLQVEGVREALLASNATKIFVCNNLTQPHTTSGWPASRFIRTVLSYTGGLGSLDCVIVNSAPLSMESSGHRADGHAPVRFDLDECLSLGLNVIVRPVAASNSTLHDADKLARTILFLGGGRSSRRAEKKNTLAERINEVAGAPMLPRLAES